MKPMPAAISKAFNILADVMARCIVGAMLLIGAAGCLAIVAALLLCLWMFFQGGWLFWALIGGTILLCLVVEWACRRLLGMPK